MQPILDRIPDNWGKWCSTLEEWDDIVLEIDRNISELAPDYVIHQVKEKFWELRYYIDYGSVPEEHREAVDQIIRDGETQVRELMAKLTPKS